MNADTATAGQGAAAPVTVAAVADGPADGALNVLLLHGLAADAAVWAPVQGELPGCRVWTAALPWRGEGVGAWQFGPDPVTALDDAAAAVGEPVHVAVAHSFAASLALEWAARRTPATAALRALVLVSPFYRSDPADFTWQALQYYVDNFHQILAEGIRTRARRPIDPEVALAMAEHGRDRIGPYAWTRFFNAYLATPFLPLADLDLPCLVLAGREDRAVSTDDSEALAARLPRAELRILDDCSHFAMRESPAVFAKTVTDFLSRTAPVPGATP